MRLAGQRKAGYFPIPPEAMAEVVERLRADDPTKLTICDPCAGEGAALEQLGNALGVPQDSLYAIELSQGRGSRVRERMPLANVLEPASVFGCQASFNSFSAIWLNPPYDDELGGGGREEQAFLLKVANWLRPGGVLMLAVPDRVVGMWEQTTKYLRQKFDDVRMIEYPEEDRHYREVVVFGHLKPGLGEPVMDSVNLERMEQDRTYNLLPGKRPKVWLKVQPTDDEVGVMLERSPLQSIQKPPGDPGLPRPPLPVSNGHLAMMIAAGHLDGIVRPPGEPAHVVRGTSRKVQYLKESTEQQNADGSTSEKTVYGEKICLTVRLAFPSGEIRTLTQE